jgi:AraC-like DNA-binding protein
MTFESHVTPRADAVQSYRERIPAREIAGHVSCVWIQHVGAAGPAYEHRTVPNGCVEISYAVGSDVIAVSGPQRGPTVAALAPGSTVVGIRFHPGVASSFLGLPAFELVDHRVAVDRLWGRSATTLAERLAEAGSPQAAARVLEQEVVRRSQDVIDDDPVVTAAISRLQPWRPDNIGVWMAGLFISPRQLRRRFVAALGFGPKRLHRILRFQGFLALSQLRHGNHRGLARLAAEAGYADQAHLTRECSEFTGLTPRAFLEETWKSCGPTHDHEPSYAGLRRALLAGGGRALPRSASSQT